MMNMSGVCKKGFLAERTGTDTIAVSTGRSITNSETSSRFNYKEERKRLEGLIKKAQKQIEDGDKKIAEFNKMRDSLNEKLMTFTGEKAAGLAKELHELSGKIEALENSMLNAMEDQHTFENELKQLVGLS